MSEHHFSFIAVVGNSSQLILTSSVNAFQRGPHKSLNLCNCASVVRCLTPVEVRTEALKVIVTLRAAG